MSQHLQEKQSYSIRNDNHHSEGVDIIKSKKAKKSLITWNPVDGRILTERFYSIHTKLSTVQ